MRRHLLIGVLISTSLGCTGLVGGAPRAGSSGKPSSTLPKSIPSAPGGLLGPSDLISKARLTGQVRLLSDYGASIISNASGNVLSDNGLGLVSDAGGGVLSDNGLGLISKARYALAQANAPAEGLLAEARIAVVDAAGQPVLDAAGKPIEATSDRTGVYAIAAELPPKTLVLRVRLWNGGELSALLPASSQAKRVQPIDTATSLGAAFVLGEYVKGDQSILDKLPQAEADRLRSQLDSARSSLVKPPRYQPGELAALTQDLRSQSAELDESLGQIRTILLGQANLGDGLQATAVPLHEPAGIVRDASGALYVAERAFGRIRRIARDGTLSTLVLRDAKGALKRFRDTGDILAAPGGGFRVVAIGEQRIWHISPEGLVTPFAGNGTSGDASVVGRATETNMTPRHMAEGPDGTLLIGEIYSAGPRLLAVSPEGQVTVVPGTSAFGPGECGGVAIATDGTRYVIIRGKLNERLPGALWRQNPGGAWERMQGDLAPDIGALTVDAQKTVYYGELRGARVWAVSGDGSRRELVGPTGEAGAPSLLTPSALLATADGSLYVVDRSANRVHVRTSSGAWRIVAGLPVTAQGGEGQAIGINVPGGLALDATGQLVIAEGGSHSLRRWNGRTLEIVAGSVAGFSGDGGPAGEAHLRLPTGVATHNGELWFIDSGNGRIRAIGVDGRIRTVVGLPKELNQQSPVLEPGRPVAADSHHVGGGLGLTFGPDGLPYWSDDESNQIQRLNREGQVEFVYGESVPRGTPSKAWPAEEQSLLFPSSMVFDKQGDLIVVDGFNGRIIRLSGIGTGTVTARPVMGLPVVQSITRGNEPGWAEEREGALALGQILVVPLGICIDDAGNLYVSEAGTLNFEGENRSGGLTAEVMAVLPKAPPRVLKIGTDGRVTTLAGPGGRFFSDAEGADALGLPTNLTIDGEGRLVIADSGANLIRYLPRGSY